VQQETGQEYEQELQRVPLPLWRPVNSLAACPQQHPPPLSTPSPSAALQHLHCHIKCWWGSTLKDGLLHTPTLGLIITFGRGRVKGHTGTVAVGRMCWSDGELCQTVSALSGPAIHTAAYAVPGDAHIVRRSLTQCD
jgi:hypothetical protein